MKEKLKAFKDWFFAKPVKITPGDKYVPSHNPCADVYNYIDYSSDPTVMTKEVHWLDAISEDDELDAIVVANNFEGIEMDTHKTWTDWYLYKKKYGVSQTYKSSLRPQDYMRQQVPALQELVQCPVNPYQDMFQKYLDLGIISQKEAKGWDFKDSTCIKATLWAIIQHMNDSHGWSRERIADWIETLDLDIQFKTPTGEENEQD